MSLSTPPFLRARMRGIFGTTYLKGVIFAIFPPLYRFHYRRLKAKMRRLLYDYGSTRALLAPGMVQLLRAHADIDTHYLPTPAILRLPPLCRDAT